MTKVGKNLTVDFSEEEVKFYKVVTKDLKSAWLGSTSEIIDLAVDYKLDEWVYPMKDTQLMVFSDLDAARRWSTRGWSTFIYCEFYIFECKIKKSKCAYFVYTDRYWIEKFLLSQDKKSFLLHNNHLVDTPPNHTVFCDAVKLIKKVVPDDYD
jgi:hypothetical protein